MTKKEFIFSNQRRHRITRHVVFWMVWWFSFVIFFHWPHHTFKGWDFNGPVNSNIQTIGLVQLILKTLFINSLLSILVPQILLTYCVTDWLLPNYFYKKRNPFIAVFIIVAVLVLYAVVATVFKSITPLFNYSTGLSKKLPSLIGLMQAILRDQITTLPIVMGFAIMIKLIKRWWRKLKETEQLAGETAKAELQLLKAQIHPHFLFNTLNNIYFFTLTNSAQAPEMIKKLSGILNYILNECNRPLVPLAKEITMIEDYMAIEKIRYGEQMKMIMEIDNNYNDKMIAPLLLIPFVENSFKHGTSKMIDRSWVKLTIKVENDLLYFSIINSRPNTESISAKSHSIDRQGNIGLKNVKKRLQLLYPASHELSITEQAEDFTVHLKILLNEPSISVSNNEEIKPDSMYALA